MYEQCGGSASLLIGDELHGPDEYFFPFDSLDDLEPGMAYVIQSDGCQVGEEPWPPGSQDPSASDWSSRLQSFPNDPSRFLERS